MDYNKPYTNLAFAYDYLLRHVDYEVWYEYIRTIMNNYVGVPEQVIELGCGTGKFGAKFSRDNYSILGIDYSLDMLRVAKTRAFKNFRIFCADMRNFSLARKSDFIFSVHDTMNYFLTEADVSAVLTSVKEIMTPKGVFMFDMTSEFNINNNFHNKKNTYKLHGTKIEWNNRYDREKKLVYSYLTFINKDGSCETEQHVQRIYTINEMSSLLHDQDFEIIDILSDYTLMPPDGESVMINFITRLRS